MKRKTIGQIAGVWYVDLAEGFLGLSDIDWSKYDWLWIEETVGDEKQIFLSRDQGKTFVHLTGRALLAFRIELLFWRTRKNLLRFWRNLRK